MKIIVSQSISSPSIVFISIQFLKLNTKEVDVDAHPIADLAIDAQPDADKLLFWWFSIQLFLHLLCL